MVMDRLTYSNLSIWEDVLNKYAEDTVDYCTAASNSSQQVSDSRQPRVAGFLVPDEQKQLRPRLAGGSRAAQKVKRHIILSLCPTILVAHSLGGYSHRERWSRSP